LEERQHVATLQLTAEHHITIRVDAMNLKNRLRDIETDSRNRLHDLAPPNHGCPHSTHHSWHSCAGGGAVHSINCGNSFWRSIRVTTIDSV
jgi:hypothetical protein